MIALRSSAFVSCFRLIDVLLSRGQWVVMCLSNGFWCLIVPSHALERGLLAPEGGLLFCLLYGMRRHSIALVERLLCYLLH